MKQIILGLTLILTAYFPSLAFADSECPKGGIPQLVCDVENGKYAAVDRLMAWKDGKLFLDEIFTPRYEIVSDSSHAGVPDQYRYNDRRFHPFHQGTDLHSLQSVTKSVTSLGIGLAIRDGLINSVNDPAIKYLGAFKDLFNGEEWGAITVEDLLTMRSGIEWKNPDGSSGYSTNHPTTLMEISDHWIPQVLTKPVTTKPGTKFDYNDGVSFLLGEIIHQVTGMRADKYIAREVFKPLGIEEYHWKITPAGETDTEGGLYLKSEDFGKIGLMMLNNGKWNDKQVIPSNWVKESVKNRVQLSTEGDETAYGYQWWLSKVGAGRYTAWTARGYGGQYLMIVSDLEMVMVLNGWSTNPGETTFGILDKIVREHE